MTSIQDVIKGKRVLITGANRGLGKAFAEICIQNGASKIYAAARDPSSINGDQLTPVQMDVTSNKDVDAAAAACGDVDILINNAGVMLTSPVLAANSLKSLSQEIDVNVVGMLRVSKAFAPILARNGGGAIINILSVVSWFVNPANPTYCISKNAASAATDALRMELKSQGTQVVGVYAGLVDTDMGAALSSGPKASTTYRRGGSVPRHRREEPSSAHRGARKIYLGLGSRRSGCFACTDAAAVGQTASR